MSSQPSIIDPLGDKEVVIDYRYTISSYGVDYPIDALVKRINNGDIYIPDFQRDYVWTLKQASKFIESLLLGFPVPGIFLAKDNVTPKLAVLDGLQRLRTLQYFFGGIIPQNERAFRLKGVQKEFEGLRYQDLTDDDRVRIENFIIHATVVKQDEPSEDKSGIYYLFERINTGGTQLAAQEIRTCLSFGSFCDLLADLNTLHEWRDIFGPPNKRMRDQEMILRFFAMLYSRDQYKRPMKSFLNMALGHNREFQLLKERDLRSDFVNTIQMIHGSLGSGAFRPQRAFNAAAFDSVMVGVATSLKSGRSLTPARLQKSYLKLMGDMKYQILVTKSTADEEAVASRMEMAIKAFK